MWTVISAETMVDRSDAPARPGGNGAEVVCQEVVAAGPHGVVIVGHVLSSRAPEKSGAAFSSASARHLPRPSCCLHGEEARHVEVTPETFQQLVWAQGVPRHGNAGERVPITIETSWAWRAPELEGDDGGPLPPGAGAEDAQRIDAPTGAVEWCPPLGIIRQVSAPWAAIVSRPTLYDVVRWRHQPDRPGPMAGLCRALEAVAGDGL